MRRKPKSDDLCKEVRDFLKMKKPSTRTIYKSGLRRFPQFYKKHHGEEANIRDFLKAVSEDLKRPPLEQNRVAETELNAFGEYLQGLVLEKTNSKMCANTIRLYLASLQNLLKYYHMHVSMSLQFSCFYLSQAGKMA